MTQALLVIDVQNEYFAGANGAFPQENADETAAKIPLNFRTTAKVATTDDAVIGESIAVKPAKKKAESPATKRLRKSKRSKARSKK